MEKGTLSSYGWIVIVTLVMAVMLALASPFGTYVGDGVVSIVRGYTTTGDTALENRGELEEQWMDKLNNGLNGSGDENDEEDDA